MLDKIWFILIINIIFSGIHFSKKINFKNYNFKNLTSKINKESLFLALGTKMGVGTIIGTTLSIYIGGPSTIIWIYLFTIISSSLIYVESYLGSKYKEKTMTSYIGGIYYYTKQGLKNKKLATLMLIIFITTYSIFFLMIQTNTIINTLLINKKLFTLILISLVTLLITNNVDEIRKILNKLVPIITVFFISISLYTILKNIALLPNIIKLIFKDLFTLKSITIGLVIGIKRSIFLNELLIGTTSMSSAVGNKNAYITANTLVLGSYFIVFVISTLIALLNLIYIYKFGIHDTSYISLLKHVFYFHYQDFGNYFLSLIITLLASSSIISGIYIGLSNITHLTKNKLIIYITKIFVLSSLILGVYIDTTLIWKFIDIMMFILISLNLIIIHKLSDLNDFV